MKAVSLKSSMAPSRVNSNLTPKYEGGGAEGEGDSGGGDNGGSGDDGGGDTGENGGVVGGGDRSEVAVELPVITTTRIVTPPAIAVSPPAISKFLLDKYDLLGFSCDTGGLFRVRGLTTPTLITDIVF